MQKEGLVTLQNMQEEKSELNEGRSDVTLLKTDHPEETVRKSMIEEPG